MTKEPIGIYIRKIFGDQQSDEHLIAAVKSYADQQALVLPAQLRIAKTAKGKPYLSGSPQLHFSLSHSGEYWVCAVGNTPLGIDIQKHQDCRRDLIARRFFHSEEYQWLKENDYADFFPVWAAKESFVKYLGQGIDEGFSTFSVIADNALARKIDDVELRPIPFLAEYSLCICSADTSAVEVYWLDQLTNK